MRPFFHPTFGSRPAQLVGRDQIIESFMEGLREPIGSRSRCSIIVGQRGIGKTALLLELAERAAREDYVVARVTAYEHMTEDILETIQMNGARFIPKEERHVQGFEAGILGFSFGLSFSEQTQKQYGFRTKLTLLCDRLAKVGKGILILVDEAKTSAEMRQLAICYQHLIGEEKNVALVMAGLPHAISSILNDDVLTFLNRAMKYPLGPIPIIEIRNYYMQAFSKLGISCTEELCRKAAEETRGFPYLMQLIGYYLERNVRESKEITGEILSISGEQARLDMEENVFAPVLKPLSDNDLSFLMAMSKDDGISRISEVGKRLGKKNSFLQPYRARLMDAGIIESPRTGELVFAVPYLADYLQSGRYSR